MDVIGGNRLKNFLYLGLSISVELKLMELLCSLFWVTIERVPLVILVLAVKRNSLIDGGDDVVFGIVVDLWALRLETHLNLIIQEYLIERGIMIIKDMNMQFFWPVVSLIPSFRLFWSLSCFWDEGLSGCPWYRLSCTRHALLSKIYSLLLHFSNQLTRTWMKT